MDDQAFYRSQLHPGTLGRLHLLFAPEDRAEAERILATSYPGDDDQRCQYAALKLSEGNLDELRSAVEGDYRDLLMAAGFGEPGKHLHWLTEDQWLEPELPFPPPGALRRPATDRSDDGVPPRTSWKDEPLLAILFPFVLLGLALLVLLKLGAFAPPS
jgi:hypothetical protein